MHPVGYSIMFMDDCYDRKASVTVIAEDALAAIALAHEHIQNTGRFVGCKEWKPRWVQSDASDVPQIISESVLREYAEKIGCDLIKRS